MLLSLRRMKGRADGCFAGFTLIELLIVVLILGILLAVALPLYLSSFKTSVAKSVKENLRTIAVAAHAYKFRTGSYPATYTNATRSAAQPPGGFIGPGRDLEAMPSGPRTVWYEWYIGDSVNNTGHFIVKANEGGENLWGSSQGTSAAETDDGAMFDLERNRYYTDGNAIFQ